MEEYEILVSNYYTLSEEFAAALQVDLSVPETFERAQELIACISALVATLAFQYGHDSGVRLARAQPGDIPPAWKALRLDGGLLQAGEPVEPSSDDGELHGMYQKFYTPY